MLISRRLLLVGGAGGNQIAKLKLRAEEPDQRNRLGDFRFLPPTLYAREIADIDAGRRLNIRQGQRAGQSQGAEFGVHAASMLKRIPWRKWLYLSALRYRIASD